MNIFLLTHLFLSVPALFISLAAILAPRFSSALLLSLFSAAAVISGILLSFSLQLGFVASCLRLGPYLLLIGISYIRLINWRKINLTNNAYAN